MISWLDVKLSLRMLVKHPGLTIIGGLGVAAGVAFAAIMIVVGLVAALGPARRGLRVQPAEALRAES
jgi:ABC-type antimicrobial peptide transport system permease subunit